MTARSAQRLTRGERIWLWASLPWWLGALWQWREHYLETHARFPDDTSIEVAAGLAALCIFAGLVHIAIVGFVTTVRRYDLRRQMRS